MEWALRFGHRSHFSKKRPPSDLVSQAKVHQGHINNILTLAANPADAARCEEELKHESRHIARFLGNVKQHPSFESAFSMAGTIMERLASLRQQIKDRPDTIPNADFQPLRADVQTWINELQAGLNAHGIIPIDQSKPVMEIFEHVIAARGHLKGIEDEIEARGLQWSHLQQIESGLIPRLQKGFRAQIESLPANQEIAGALVTELATFRDTFEERMASVVKAEQANHKQHADVLAAALAVSTDCRPILDRIIVKFSQIGIDENSDPEQLQLVA